MNSVVNPVTSYGFTASQATFGGMGRGYGTAATANLQRPSFAIQELLGLGATQLGASAQGQGFTSPHQLFPTNDIPNTGVSYPYQNFASSPPSMGQASIGGETADFASSVNSMYSSGMGWRTAGFLSGYPRDDSLQPRQVNHDINGHSPDKHALSPLSQGQYSEYQSLFNVSYFIVFILLFK